ncbi:DNA gyrase inhibitor YacG [Rhodomicrobium sp. Az07]|uniref:DNA gyrase inhibitor YacG n=1 Tax=Rhodomicrobium sp. Az07 TaxID=2839034 RepID=UPI001BED0567|nr:DNA gyrase inhibitor YacG [Rhodomicrobium sp. Az07]MBT3071458.1 DNA gyrase inhibitor YacG [Rhodomicrobium sp. Az07]
MGDRLTGEPNESEALCVICGRQPQVPEYRPFCSRRCADVDLHRWLGGVYAIPGKPEEEEDEERNGSG